MTVQITEAYGMLVLHGQEYKGRGIGDSISLDGDTFEAVNLGVYETHPIARLAEYLDAFGGIEEQGESDVFDEEIGTTFKTEQGQVTFGAGQADEVYRFVVGEDPRFPSWRSKAAPGL